MSEERLIDVGERRIISEYLRPRYGPRSKWRYGDDCAVIFDASLSPNGMIVATADPGPKPVAWDLANGDYYYWGWLTAAVNWSDIAAAGADPLGLVTSLTLPNNMRISDFLRLLDGIDACSDLIGSEVQGGNLKEGNSVCCEATALGVVRGGSPLSRRGAQPGEVICALGHTGLFWSGLLALEAGIALSEQDTELVRQALLEPIPLVEVGKRVRTHSLVSACTDNSDGLYGALWSLSESSGVGVEIDADSFEYSDVVRRISDTVNTDVTRLAFGFGDLQLVCSSPQAKVGDLRSVCEDLSIGFSTLGRVTDGTDLLLIKDGKSGRLANLDNERFTRSSQFTAGLQSYRVRLFEGPLWEKSFG
jgi:thiamine-monophosphate kinase